MQHPGPLDVIRDPANPPQDFISQREQQSIFADLVRKEKIRNVLNGVFIWFIRIVSAIGIIIITVRLAHLILPDHYRWLTDEQIHGIDKIFFSGAIGGFLVSYFKKANDNS